ncbi:MAG: efflux RND transporter periplasmic adaptor subunit [Terriglobia bacterium]|jgi:cobalt-zinc-cadmium efflux system membrane fusion protein|nr:efflux RND transporter periplasmic adaptor subunit [Terriglobia bacterium]
MDLSRFGLKRKHVAALLAVLVAALALACSNDSDKVDAASKKAGDQARLFSVPQDQLSHLGIYTVEPTSLERVLRLPGSVAYNGFTTTPVISQVSGPVGRIVVVPGQVVRAGQPMLYVSSPDFAQLRSNYIKANDAHALAHKNYVRAQDLYQHKAVSERDYEAAQSAEIQAQADLEAAEQSLRIVGITDPAALTKSQSPEVPVSAPISGEVVDRQVAPGQLLQGGNTQCFTISNMHTVWVMVNVYQQDLAAVHVGDVAKIKTDAYPDIFTGKISYIGAALDPNTRTLQARVVTPNPQEKLKKDMYVNVVLHAGTIKDALAVPDSAVLRNNDNEPFVYVNQGENKFGERLVKVGESSNGKTQIVSGLNPGDRVVADGSLFLQFQNSLQ